MLLGEILEYHTTILQAPSGRFGPRYNSLAGWDSGFGPFADLELQLVLTQVPQTRRVKIIRICMGILITN